MNRIILVGNGFDKAHGMKTAYGDFIDDYWEKVCMQIYDGRKVTPFEDDCITFYLPGYSCVNLRYHGGELRRYSDFLDFLRYCRNKQLGFKLVFKNEFFGKLSKASLENWVDVENEYYSSLVDVLQSKGTPSEIQRLVKLNQDFARVSSMLEIYLTKIGQPICEMEGLRDIIFSPLNERDIAHSHKMGLTKHIQQRVDRIDIELKRAHGDGRNLGCEYEGVDFDEIGHWVNKFREIKERGTRRQQIRKNFGLLPDFLLLPDEIMILTFNYTDTVERYIPTQTQSLLPHVECVYIHGKLNDISNPMIFGYGDELDRNYKDIEDRNDNRYLEYIKSTGYHRTDGYRRLLEFAESGYFQILTMGHSCGNSDRTLLYTLFEHPNCMSIKPYYYQKSPNTDNYSDIVRNISRSFRDKQLMRARVVNKTYCEPLPQFKE